MIHNRNRLLAAALAMAVALGECSGITALAAENAAALERTVSENNISVEEEPTVNDVQAKEDDAPSISLDVLDAGEEQNPLPDTDTIPETGKPDRAETLPALHIGQISDGETLPSSDEDLIYDLPVSLTADEKRILFVNYGLETTLGYDGAGILEWSILRGEKGMEPGNTSILDEEDDWHGFETVPASPFFVMEEMTDTQSGYFPMMSLSSVETAGDGSYDYYIRAAYYPETEDGKAEAFYSAATIPFVPQSDTVTNEGQTSEVPAGTEENSSVSENSSASENSTVSENSSASGNSTVSENSSASGNSTVSENSSSAEANADTAVDDFSKDTLPEEDVLIADKSSTIPVVLAPVMSNELSREAEKADVTSVILDKTETLTMQPEGEAQLTATVTAAPSGADIPPLLWESSSESVASVTAGENGTATITAVAEGYARITASCGGKTASITVDVVPDTASPDDKLLDLSSEIRVSGFKKESDSLVYTGQKVTQDLRVYYKENLLTEKTDYTLTYRNNINAAAWNTAKAPSVTVNLRGQYQGSVTLYYTINPLDINQINIYAADSAKTPAYEQTVNYGKNVKIPAPTLNFGKKRLAAKRDFVCDYAPLTEQLKGADYTKGDSYEAGKVYHYTVNGTGNFTGSFQMDLVVLKDDLKKKNFSTASVKLDKTRYDYRGTPLSKADVKIETLKISGLALSENFYDYEVCASGLDGASLTIFPTQEGRAAGYRGCKKISLKLAGDRKISAAVFGENWKNEMRFSQHTVDKKGGMFQEKTGLLKFGSDTLVEGTDYTIKYSNAKKVGNVAVTFKGLGRYTGAVTKRYQITPNSDSQNLTVVWGDNVTKNADGSLSTPYQKNGAAPEFYIRDENYAVLNSKTDYTVQLKDNRKPSAETQKDMTCTIRGKGNYRGYEKVVTLTVTKAAISNASIRVLDKPYDARPHKWKSNVIVTDRNGKKLAAGTDYVREIAYTYDGMDPADQNAVPSAGKSVTVTVTGTGFYEGTLTCENAYHIYDRANDIGKLRIEIDPQTYTGSEIRLEKSNIHVYANAADQKAKKELDKKDSCFEIIDSSYKNNIKTGTAKVTLHGIGTYGGERTCSFKIQRKVYGINRVKGILLDKTRHSFSLAANEEQRKLTAAITPETVGQPLTNPTVIWTSSNNKIATVESVMTDAKDNPQGAYTASAIIHAQGTGNVTITAVTQDGSKKATCKITISASVFTQADQTINGKVGDTYQLTLDGNENQEILSDSVAFESDNPNVVSVSDRGLLSMKKVGAATIRVTIGRDTAKQCYVVVKGNTADPENDSRALVYHQAAGCLDDTPQINRLLREWEWNPDRYDYMYIPEGIYHIDAVKDFGGIVLTDNQTLIMSPAAQLVAIGNDKSNSQMIFAFGRKNIVISGGKLVGERSSHTGGSGEWGHGINIAGCTNVHIQDVEISECWGDGIYLGLYDGWDSAGNRTKFFSSGITITNCNLHHNRRNNLSITDAGSVTIRNCQFNYAGSFNGQPGHDPQFGIDIEPNISGYVCRNVKIYDSEFKGNTKASLGIITAADGVTLEGCSYDGPIYNKAGKNVTVNGKPFPIN